LPLNLIEQVNGYGRQDFRLVQAMPSIIR